MQWIEPLAPKSSFMPIFKGVQTPRRGRVHVVSLALMVAAIAIAADGEARYSV